MLPAFFMLPLLFAGLGVLVLGFALLPLLRGGRAVAGRGSFDRAVYRDQLEELDRDFARGLITETEAAGARLEIQRRLLATEPGDEPGGGQRRASGGERAPARLSRSPALAMVLALLVIGGASTLYLRLGAPTVPGVPFASRTQDAGEQVAGDTGRKAIEDAASGLAARLAEKPDDGRLWALYARTEAMLSSWDKAVDAFQRAIRLGESGAEVQAGYGEMLVMQAAGVVTQPARDAFETVLKADPASDVARYYLALAAGQAGQFRQAIEQLQALAADLPSDNPMRAEIGRRIAEAATQGGLPKPQLAAGKPPAGPSESDGGMPDPQAMGQAGVGASGSGQQAMAAAAAGMPEADRKAMVAGMVTKLAARMEQNPSDLEGWMRLGRAYTVMGDRPKAVAAYDHALALRQDDPEIKLMTVEAMLTGLPAAEPFPPRAIKLLREVQLVSPDEPAVLWYLGLQAARNGRRDEARTYWTRLLARMPAGQDAEMVKSALDQVKGS